MQNVTFSKTNRRTSTELVRICEVYLILSSYETLFAVFLSAKFNRFRPSFTAQSFADFRKRRKKEKAKKKKSAMVETLNFLGIVTYSYYFYSRNTWHNQHCDSRWGVKLYGNVLVVKNIDFSNL